MMNNKIWAVSTISIILLFNFLFFLFMGFEHTSTAWTSYAFIQFAFVILLITPLTTPKVSDELVFTYTTMWISILYLLASSFIGGFFLITGYDNFNISLSILLTVTVAFILLLFLTIMMNKRSADSGIEIKKNILYLQEIVMELDNIWRGCTDEPLKKKIEHVRDRAKNSQTTSPDCIRGIDNEILIEMDKLKEAVSNDDGSSIRAQVEHLEQLFNQRDDEIRLNRFR